MRGLVIGLAISLAFWAVVIALFVVACQGGENRAESTAYCLRGTMADGTYTRPHSVAMNRHPLGTRIELLGRRGPDGKRRYIVRDRIGYGTELDFWVPTCSEAYAWGRRSVRYRLGWARR